MLLDEIGRGTATYDGLALAWAVTEHLHAGDGPRPRTIFATHYHELTQLAGSLPRLANIHVTVDDVGRRAWCSCTASPTGPADRSYGIHVARLAGLPGERCWPGRARCWPSSRASARSSTWSRPGAAAARAPGAPTNQLPLFGAEPHPVLEELRRLELERLSPLEALNRIARVEAEPRAGMTAVRRAGAARGAPARARGARRAAAPSGRAAPRGARPPTRRACANQARMSESGSQRSQERGSYSRHITGCRPWMRQRPSAPSSAQRVAKCTDQRSGRST